MKLYVAEEGSADVRAQVDRAAQIATSRVAYPEARAAFARRRREGGLGAAGLRAAVAALDRDVGRYVTVEVDAVLARRAGDLAERRALRGFDAIHLASALTLRDLVGADIAFLAFDGALTGAATAEGFGPLG